MFLVLVPRPQIVLCNKAIFQWVRRNGWYFLYQELLAIVIASRVFVGHKIFLKIGETICGFIGAAQEYPNGPQKFAWAIKIVFDDKMASQMVRNIVNK